MARIALAQRADDSPRASAMIASSPNATTTGINEPAGYAGWLQLWLDKSRIWLGHTPMPKEIAEAEADEFKPHLQAVGVPLERIGDVVNEAFRGRAEHRRGFPLSVEDLLAAWERLVPVRSGYSSQVTEYIARSEAEHAVIECISRELPPLDSAVLAAEIAAIRAKVLARCPQAEDWDRETWESTIKVHLTRARMWGWQDPG